MSWLADYVPWWVWLLMSVTGVGGTAAALIIFVPAAAPFLLGIWNRLPLWLKVTLMAIGAAPFIYLAGRNAGSQREQEKNKERAADALHNRVEVESEVKRLSPDQIDKELERKGDFRD